MMSKKKILFVAVIAFASFSIKAQDASSYELGVGLKFQKTEQLYWENGVTADYTSDFLMNKKIHLKLSYVTSRLGSALASNAIKQDNIVLGADWHFRSDKDFQILAGLNTGFFHYDVENPIFASLPNNSMLFSLETGLFYKFKFPMAASLTAGYNLINGNGVNIPGTIFPVYYQLSLYYNIGK